MNTKLDESVMSNNTLHVLSIPRLNKVLVLCYSVFVRGQNVSADRASLLLATYHELGKC